MFKVECVMEKLLVYRRENDTSVDFDRRQLETGSTELSLSTRGRDDRRRACRPAVVAR